MKNLFVILFVTSSLSMLSCDEEMFYDYIVQNNCDEPIMVTYDTYDTPNKNIQIDKYGIDTIYSYSIIEGMKIDEKRIIFNSMSIKCDTIKSEVDFLSNDTWEYHKKSDTHAVYYLKIDNTYFE